MPLRITKCAWCGRARRRVAIDYGNPTGNAVILHSDRFKSLKMHASCVGQFTDSLRNGIGFDPYLVPFIGAEFGYVADEIRNA